MFSSSSRLSTSFWICLIPAEYWLRLDFCIWANSSNFERIDPLRLLGPFLVHFFRDSWHLCRPLTVVINFLEWVARLVFPTFFYDFPTCTPFIPTCFILNNFMYLFFVDELFPILIKMGRWSEFCARWVTTTVYLKIDDHVQCQKLYPIFLWWIIVLLYFYSRWTCSLESQSHLIHNPPLSIESPPSVYKIWWPFLISHDSAEFH